MKKSYIYILIAFVAILLFVIGGVSLFLTDSSDSTSVLSSTDAVSTPSATTNKQEPKVIDSDTVSASISVKLK